MAETAPQQGPQQPRGSWKWMLVLGIVMILGGLIALANPFIASLTVVAIAGAAFLLAGALQLWMAFGDDEESGAERAMNALLGVALILLAVLLLANPLSGLVTLTVALAALFLVSGVLRIVIGMRLRARSGWGWGVASGVLSVILGLLIFFALPAAAPGLLGLFLGIDLLASGIVSIMLALRQRRGV